MRKKLPKAIGQTIDDLRRSKPNTRDETKSSRVSLASIPSPVAGVRAGDVLAEKVRSRLKSSNRAVAVNRAERLALVPVTRAKSTPDKADAPTRMPGKPKKPAGSE